MRKLLTTLTVLVILLASVDAATRRDGSPPLGSDLQAASTESTPSRAERLGLPRDTPTELEGWRRVEDFPHEIAQLKTVFWEPRDTESLRRLIRETAIVEGKTVLEIGTGTGLLSLCCLRAGAARVVGTDVNPSAIANAAYNAEVLGVAERLEPRLIPLDRSGAFSMIGDSERFDLIISNPPWEDWTPDRIDDYALYDEHFALMRSLLRGLGDHLKPGGKALLAYGCVDAIRTLQRLAREYDLSVRKLDDRDPEDLPEVFLPGMLFEVVPRDQATGHEGGGHSPSVRPSDASGSGIGGTSR